jgi:acyl carrier protein
MEKLIATLQSAKPETDIEDILAAKDLYGQGLVDSLDILVILDELNAAFGIEIGGSEVRREDFMTVESLCRLVQRCGGACRSPE